MIETAMKHHLERKLEDLKRLKLEKIENFDFFSVSQHFFGSLETKFSVVNVSTFDSFLLFHPDPCLSLLELFHPAL